jgi:hypothetical protein
VPIAGIVPIALATVWTALVAETVIESARTLGGSIVVFGRTLLNPDPRVGVLILCALSASTALVWTVVVAYVRGRRLERRMAAELDEKYQEITTRAAGDVARAGLVTWRIGELRTSMEELSDRREQVLAEMELARRRTAELRALAEDYKRSLRDLQDRLIILPDIEDELARRRAERKSADPGR